MSRVVLPYRRPLLTMVVAWPSATFTISVGFDEFSQPKEVFADGAKIGSELGSTVADACVLISVSLQNGIAADDLAKSLGRVPARGGSTEPASVIGAIMAVLVKREWGNGDV